MISQAYRTANSLWSDLSLTESGSVLFDHGLLDEIPVQVVMTSPRIERFYVAADKMSADERDRFMQKAISLWNLEKRIKKDSMAFLNDTDEGFSDRIIIVLGLHQRPVKSRVITAQLNETGSAPKNSRNLLQQLMKAGAVQEETAEEGGETLFSLTEEGILRRNQLLGLN